jgi:hypothetical protein
VKPWMFAQRFEQITITYVSTSTVRNWCSWWNGGYSLSFMMKESIWYFVSDAPKVLTTFILVMHVWVWPETNTLHDEGNLFEFSLCSHIIIWCLQSLDSFQIVSHVLTTYWEHCCVNRFKTLH